MSRRKKGNPVNGWVALDKPPGMTSTQAVGKVRWLFQAQKAGHAGTLDPLATGVLPIALGEATKTVPYAVDAAKSYRFAVRWGEETSTDDSEGECTRACEKRPTRSEIESVLGDFCGEIQQVPPQFSAVKVDGARAYDLARDGEEFELQARTVEIERLEIVDMPNADTTILDADCGKGTYVRSLARDLGRKLGCFGHVVELRRMRVGSFHVDDCVPLEELIEIGEPKLQGEPHGDLSAFLLPVEAVLGDMLQLHVSAQDAARLANGQPVLLRGRDAPITSGPAYATHRGKLVALGEIEHGELHPLRVFNL